MIELNINLNLILIVSLAIFLLFLIFWQLLVASKKRAFFARGMSSALFLVSLPRGIEKDKEVSLEEYLKGAEQFYSSLAGIKEPSFFKRLFLGNPCFVFEVALHRAGEEICFYLACPRNFAQLMEKQILGFWPKAQVQPVKDYNIFNADGKSVASFAKLTKDYIYPLKMTQEFSIDPLSSMTSIFTKLAKEGEGAAIQILIRPSKISLGARVKKTLEGIQKNDAPKINKDFQLPSSGLSPLAQSQINVVSQKASQVLFDVNLRILASANDEFRAKEILEQFHSAFDQFSSFNSNQIKFKKLKGARLRKLFYDFSFRIFNEAESMLLSSGELSPLFHFPSANLLTPNIKWLKARQAPPPGNLPKEGLVIGKNIFRSNESVVKILKDDMRRHFYIIGQTGTGKSAFLQEMIRQDMEQREGLALIDPHGDIAESVLELVPSSRAKEVIYFNPGDFEMPMGLNMLEFDQRYPESKTFVVNEMIEIFDKLYDLKATGGPMFEQYMRNALLLVMEDPLSGSTLLEVPRVLADVNFRKLKLSRCNNIIVKNFWEKEAEKAGGEAALANMVPYITSKLNNFTANDLMRPIIAQQNSSFNFRQVMDEQKILIVNLSKGRLGDINSHFLGMIIAGKLLIAAFSRADIPESQRKDFHIYIDEFQNITTNTMAAVLAEARKYRLSMVFAHQFIGQLTEQIQKAVFGNVGSMMAFRVGVDDAKYLVNQFEPVFSENDLVNFDNYNAALRLLIKGETSRPFNVVTYPPLKGNKELAKLIKDYSRVKYGRSRAEVESETYQRLQG